ncbi:hypothetical protein [Legionella birminghamensis]|nr:hypothetical protein [Legionella birminghamensis]
MNGRLSALIALFLHFSVASAANDAFIETAVHSMQKCYVQQTNKNDGLSLAKCISDQLKIIPNPENYIVNLEGKEPHHLTLYLYNPKGFRIICLLRGGKTLEIDTCDTYKAKPLNADQQLSIDPNESTQ